MIRSVTAELDAQGKVRSLEEKSQLPKSNYAVTGLNFHDAQVVELAKTLKPSPRGKLEITDFKRRYLEQEQFSVEIMGQGYSSSAARTHESLLDASQFFNTLENHQGLKVARPEKIACRLDWIDTVHLEALARTLAKNISGSSC